MKNVTSLCHITTVPALLTAPTVPSSAHRPASPTSPALPLLTGARLAPDASPSTAFWGAAALLALRIAADGKLLPDLSGTDHDAWRAGPLTAEDQERVRLLAAAMPAVAHSVPLGTAPPRSLVLPAPERLLRSFVDAVVAGLPRTPAAPLSARAPDLARPRRPPRGRHGTGQDHHARLPCHVSMLSR
ncbi:hypothetical protein [Streptomyces hebeiensis]